MWEESKYIPEWFAAACNWVAKFKCGHTSSEGGPYQGYPESHQEGRNHYKN